MLEEQERALEEKREKLENHAWIRDVLKKAIQNPAWKDIRDRAFEHPLPEPEEETKKRKSEEYVIG